MCRSIPLIHFFNPITSFPYIYKVFYFILFYFILSILIFPYPFFLWRLTLIRSSGISPYGCYCGEQYAYDSFWLSYKKKLGIYSLFQNLRPLNALSSASYSNKDCKPKIPRCVAKVSLGSEIGLRYPRSFYLTLSNPLSKF